MEAAYFTFDFFANNYIRQEVYCIRQNPVATAIGYDDIRTAVQYTFPYMIHYSNDEDKEAVAIYAVLGTSRDLKI